jgi:alanyl-tRNA synthetase
MKREGVILDRTLFYPQGGGQVSDKGKLDKEGLVLKVETVSKEGNDIIHQISSNVESKIKKGDIVTGKIDWNYRYGVMRAHSAQHILSALIKNKFNIDTAHANISFEHVSLQIAQDIDDNQFKEVLQEFNRVCTIENHEFRTSLIQRDEIKNFIEKIRGKIPEQGEIRLVELKNYDLICCGGTHVQNSTEIGPIFVNEFNKGKNFKFKVGLNAINQISADNIEILRYARLLNIPTSEILHNFQIQLEKKTTLQQNYINLANIALEFVSLYPVTIIKNVKVGFLELNLEYKIIQKQFKEFPVDYLLIIKQENNRLLVLSNNEEVKANKVLESLLKRCGGKGGGNPHSAQGTLTEEPEDLISEIKSVLTLDSKTLNK